MVPEVVALFERYRALLAAKGKIASRPFWNLAGICAGLEADFIQWLRPG
jgi:hypothetical protein